MCELDSVWYADDMSLCVCVSCDVNTNMINELGFCDRDEINVSMFLHKASQCFNVFNVFNMGSMFSKP